VPAGAILALSVLAGASPPATAGGFSVQACLVKGAGMTDQGATPDIWRRLDASARSSACREAERLHRERERWETERRVARDRAQALHAATRFRAARARGAEGGSAGSETASAGAAAARQSAVADELSPCASPASTGECRATTAQILYQIQRSREAARLAATP
jgi:hypothetical protein